MPKDPLLESRFLRVRSQLPSKTSTTWASPRIELFGARNAIFHGLKVLGISRGAHVLVPAYLCTAAIEPILAFGATVGFYQVGRHCEPDFYDIERKMTAETRAVLGVHYFGFPQPLVRLKELCDRYGVALIEDCAHVLQGSIDGVPMGSIGDVSVFSWRKFLPLYAGGDLILNRVRRAVAIDWASESIPLWIKEVKTIIEKTSRTGELPIVDKLRRILSKGRRDRRIPYETRDSGGEQEVPVTGGDCFDPLLENMPMTRLSKWLRAHSNIEVIVEVRRRNYQYLSERLLSLKGVTPLFQTLPQEACPWIFPVILDEMANAHLALRAQGIPAVTWGGVRHYSVPKNEYHQADFFYDNLVFLPLHQSLTTADLDRIVESVSRALSTSFRDDSDQERRK